MNMNTQAIMLKCLQKFLGPVRENLECQGKAELHDRLKWAGAQSNYISGVLVNSDLDVRYKTRNTEH